MTAQKRILAAAVGGRPHPHDIREFPRPAKWTERAACAEGAWPDLFFPGRHHVNEAKKVCTFKCPVALDCLRAALDNGETWGVWGGINFEDPSERARIGGRRVGS